MRLLSVGLSLALLGDLDELVPAGSVTVLEAPDVLTARDGVRRAAEHPCVGEVLSAPAQDEADPDRLVAFVRGLGGTPVDAVLPAVEYGVVAAATLADSLGRPGAGRGAAAILRDKLRLRAVADGAGLRQPRWAEVADLDEARARWRAHQGACVLKPADRQASLGVVLMDAGTDVGAAWRHCVGADEPLLRSRSAAPSRYLVEQRLTGPEVSVEVLVADGEPGFFNVTAKQVAPGPFPVEVGHTVPADLPPAVLDELAGAVRRLVAATGFRTGLLHAEWILVQGREPHLVECAARLPGDCIDVLIGLAHHGNLVESWLQVLLGGLPRLLPPQRPAPGGSAIRFLVAPPGRVRSVTGADAARAVPGVHEVRVTLLPGDVTGPTTDSWARGGHVLAVGPDAAAAGAAAERGLAALRVDVLDVVPERAS